MTTTTAFTNYELAKKIVCALEKRLFNNETDCPRMATSISQVIGILEDQNYINEVKKIEQNLE